MMIPLIDKFLDLLMRFSRDRKYFLFSFNAITEEVDRVFLSFLASFTARLSAGAAGQGERTSHKVRQFREEPILARGY